MLDSYALDSSVLVASLIPSDRFYDSGTNVLKRLLGSSDAVYASAIVPVEVCAAIARRTKDKAIAQEVGRQIDRWIQLGRLHILYPSAARMKRARRIGVEHLLRGMDAIVVEVAEEKQIPLVTFDQELSDRVADVVKTVTQDNLKGELPPIEEE